MSDEDIDQVFHLEMVGAGRPDFETYKPVMTYIPEQLFLLPDLWFVSIGAPAIKTVTARLDGVPETLRQAKKLKTLRLIRCGLTEMPSHMFAPNLEELILNYNEIKIVPDGISTCLKLRSFQIACNDLEYISEEIGSLRQLIALIVYDNPRLRLPDSITDLGEMERLGISKGLMTLTPAQLSWAEQNDAFRDTFY